MYSSRLEGKLILPDIADAMQDYVSIQLDIDNSKVKAAAIVAQDIDIKRVIGKENLQRVLPNIDIDEEDIAEANKQLRELIIPALCYFTYSRCLLMFQGTFTDSGYMIETEGEARNSAKSVSKEMKGIAETYMLEVIEFLQAEDPNTDTTQETLTPRVRTFGGCERRASN